MRVSARTTVPPLAAALVAGVLAGCTGDVLGPARPRRHRRPAGRGPVPAHRRRRAVHRHDRPAGVARPVVEGLGDAAAEVSVLGVEEDGDTATARLAWTWNLAEDASWSYESSARLRLVDDEWAVVARPSLVSAKLRRGERLRQVDVPPRRADIVGAGWPSPRPGPSGSPHRAGQDQGGRGQAAVVGASARAPGRRGARPLRRPRARERARGLRRGDRPPRGRGLPEPAGRGDRCAEAAP